MTSLAYSKRPSWQILRHPTNCFRALLVFSPLPGVIRWGALLGFLYIPIVAIYYVASDQYLANTLFEIVIGGFYDLEDFAVVDDEIVVNLSKLEPILYFTLLVGPVGAVVGICLLYVQAFFMLVSLNAFQVECSFTRVKSIVGWSYYTQSISIALVTLIFILLAIFIVTTANSESVPAWFSEPIPLWVIGFSVLLPLMPLLLCWYTQWRGIWVLSNLSRFQAMVVLLKSNIVFLLGLLMIIGYVQIGAEPLET